MLNRTVTRIMNRRERERERKRERGRGKEMEREREREIIAVFLYGERGGTLPPYLAVVALPPPPPPPAVYCRESIQGQFGSGVPKRVTAHSVHVHGSSVTAFSAAWVRYPLKAFVGSQFTSLSVWPAIGCHTVLYIHPLAGGGSPVTAFLFQ
jgi:hypothetical protein